MGLTLRDTSHTGQKKASSPDLAQAVSRERVASQVSSLLTKDSRFCTVPIFPQAELESAGQPRAVRHHVSPGGSRFPANSQSDLTLKCSCALITNPSLSELLGEGLSPGRRNSLPGTAQPIQVYECHLTADPTTLVFYNSLIRNLSPASLFPSSHCCDDILQS